MADDEQGPEASRLDPAFKLELEQHFKKYIDELLALNNSSVSTATMKGLVEDYKEHFETLRLLVRNRAEFDQLVQKRENAYLPFADRTISAKIPRRPKPGFFALPSALVKRF